MKAEAFVRDSIQLLMLPTVLWAIWHCSHVGVVLTLSQSLNIRLHYRLINSQMMSRSYAVAKCLRNRKTYSILSATTGEGRYFFSTSRVNQRDHKCKLLIVGGGTGGCAIASKYGKSLGGDVIVLEPSDVCLKSCIFFWACASFVLPFLTCFILNDLVL